jgi:AcrR family transcriptional regulator
MSSPESQYLDAARDRIVAVGWRRTTLTDIARRAGVSRMTIYRRWPDMKALLGDLLVREWSELLLESGMGSDRLADGISSMVAALRNNELFQRILEVDPELLHPYLFERTGRNQQWILELTEEHVRTGQADGSIRRGDPHTIAAALLLTTYGYVLSAHTLDVPAQALDAELRTQIDRYLAP